MTITSDEIHSDMRNTDEVNEPNIHGKSDLILGKEKYVSTGFCFVFRKISSEDL